MRAYSTRSADRSKGQSPILPKIHPEVPPPRVTPLSPEDRARRLAEIRAVLADAAPSFRARIAEFAPIAPGESEARP